MEIEKKQKHHQNPIENQTSRSRSHDVQTCRICTTMKIHTVLTTILMEKNKTKTLLKKKEAKFARAAIFTFLLVCAAAAYLKYYCKFPAAAFLSRA
jgi:hypothetical protein